MKKAYVDITEFDGTGTTFVGIKDTEIDTEIILVGTTINSISTNNKNDEYQRYANDYDIQFIFDDCVPHLEFYTVPLVDIIAKDSEGGFIGTVGNKFDLEGNSPICYINTELECFIISENVSGFLKNIETWKRNLELYDKVTFYHSKMEAESEFEFINLTEII